MDRIRTLVAVTMLLASPGGAAADAALEFLGASSTPLGNPHDLKLSPDGRHLLVSDVDNDRVAILDPETLAFIGSFGEDHQGGTHDVDFDAEGRVYVADTHNNRVTVYEMDGTRAMLVGDWVKAYAVQKVCSRIPTGASTLPEPGRTTWWFTRKV